MRSSSPLFASASLLLSVAVLLFCAASPVAAVKLYGYPQPNCNGSPLVLQYDNGACVADPGDESSHAIWDCDDSGSVVFTDFPAKNNVTNTHCTGTPDPEDVEVLPADFCATLPDSAGKAVQSGQRPAQNNPGPGSEYWGAGDFAADTVCACVRVLSPLLCCLQ
jgi:hypothetical protein